ncbi:MAG: aminotransferase class V-fold PLP-dependent enzyme [Synergistaceae bacterium]|nr:aminotransferase class V-fold PLP-dependent enzyme [Synergistaceae bacterium]
MTQSIYEQLNVKTMVNAWGTVTKVGGSKMAPEVLEAMREASRHYVEISTLHEAAGKRIAALLGVDACCITCGAAAGIAIAAAACMTRGDEAKKLQLPDTAGMPDEALVLKCHRTLYDQALLLSGIKVKEIGTTSFACVEQVEAAVSDRTALFFYASEAEPMRGSIDLSLIIPILKKYKVPVVVDAAAEIPPKSNIRKYLEKGADLVIFSGGKELRGPQSSGLILGNAELVAACDANCCPNYSIGRAMKIDKETIAGIVKAVELFVAKDYDRQVVIWESMTRRISEKLSQIPYAAVREGFPTEPGIQPADILRVYVKPTRKTAPQLYAELLGLDPQIYTGLSGAELVINPQCLEEDEIPVLISAFEKYL